MAEVQRQRRDAGTGACLHLVRALHDQEGSEAPDALLRFQDLVLGRQLPRQLERSTADRSASRRCRIRHSRSRPRSVRSAGNTRRSPRLACCTANCDARDDVAARAPDRRVALDEIGDLLIVRRGRIDRHRHLAPDAEPEHQIERERDQRRQHQRRARRPAAPSAARRKTPPERWTSMKNVIMPMPITSVRRESSTRDEMICTPLIMMKTAVNNSADAITGGGMIVSSADEAGLERRDRQDGRDDECDPPAGDAGGHHEADIGGGQRQSVGAEQARRSMLRCHRRRCRAGSRSCPGAPSRHRWSADRW